MNVSKRPGSPACDGNQFLLPKAPGWGMFFQGALCPEPGSAYWESPPLWSEAHFFLPQWGAASETGLGGGGPPPLPQQRGTCPADLAHSQGEAGSPAPCSCTIPTIPNWVSAQFSAPQRPELQGGEAPLASPMQALPSQ